MFIEARPTCSRQGTPIKGYEVEMAGERPLATFGTQADEIKWAKEQGHKPYVARVRHVNDK